MPKSWNRFPPGHTGVTWLRNGDSAGLSHIQSLMRCTSVDCTNDEKRPKIVAYSGLKYRPSFFVEGKCWVTSMTKWSFMIALCRPVFELAGWHDLGIIRTWTTVSYIFISDSEEDLEVEVEDHLLIDWIGSYFWPRLRCWKWVSGAIGFHYTNVVVVL